jgi:hypothetical protein
MLAYYMPLDPECPENETAAFYEDPMTVYYGMGDELGPTVEAHHRKKCQRCQEYGLANIEVEGP